MSISRQDIQKTEVKKITSIFNPSDYETFDEAMEALEFIANNRGLNEKTKLEFNRNFYGFISMIQKHFDLDFDLFRETAQGIAKLAALTPDEADRITLEGDDDKYTLKLLDTSGKYPSAFIPETGKCRFPSQWFKFYHVVMVNEL